MQRASFEARMSEEGRKVAVSGTQIEELQMAINMMQYKLNEN